MRDQRTQALRSLAWLGVFSFYDLHLLVQFWLYIEVIYFIYHRKEHELPNAAFLLGIHRRAQRAAVSLGKVLAVWQGTQHPYRTRWMHAAADLRESILRPHGTAPDLRVIEEEQLIVGEIHSWQQRFFAMDRDPLLVSLIFDEERLSSTP